MNPDIWLTFRGVFATWLGVSGTRFGTIQALMGQHDPDGSKIYVAPHDEDMETALSRLTLPPD